ncbi:MAG: AAA family ATPase [Acidimicrobiales bacterium]|nr:AAA family ATPase [Acidimicrobiales bacterium]
MTTVESVDPEVAAEQDHLDTSRRALAAMEARARTLLEELRAGGTPDPDYEMTLVRRVHALADSARPLLFGRIDEAAGESWHIGRRHVEDARADPLVVDWRAPVAVPFYRAAAADPCGLDRRRQIMVDRGRVVSLADDVFGAGEDREGELERTRLRGGDALLAELERARTGEMLDIVATIQAEQDEIIRAPLDRTMVVQGGPGTGKTAVGLHRAAYLLYNHPELSARGVLVLGPSRAFLRYIAQVLPSLGEEAVIQTTVSDLAPRVRVDRIDTEPVRRLKGDPRMAELLARALSARRRPAGDDVVLRARMVGAELSAASVDDIVDDVAAGGGPYRAGRAALRSRVTALFRRTLREMGRLEAHDPELERELAASAPFKALLDRVWPAVSTKALVRGLFGSVEQIRGLADGLLDEHEVDQLAGAAAAVRRGWSVDDLPLLDEAGALVEARARAFGHVVVDEVQDLTPMQLRMVARRAPAGSLTALGDLAQATGPWAYARWEEIVPHLPQAAGSLDREELTRGYRAPGQVLDFASRLLPVAAPSVRPTASIRPGRFPPRLRAAPPADLVAAALDESRRMADDGQLVGLVAPAPHRAALLDAAAGRADVGDIEAHGMARPITVLAPEAAKGLEFDGVVVLEPSAVAADGRRGLRLLYVAMTRPIRELVLVHAEALPEALAG